MNKVQQLKAKIAQLQKENQQFRLLAHELIEAFYRTVNKNPKKTSSPWTSNWEQIFKALSSFKNKNNQTNECSFNFDNFKEFFTKKPQETHD